MKKLALLISGFLFLSICFAFYFSSTSSAKPEEIIVYQSRTCGCCKKWVEHLKLNGFKVKSEYLDDVSAVKQKLKIPAKLTSCHTAMVNEYLIEGHVPASAIQKLLSENPKVRGISVPGMPMGSPGMEGSYKESYDVVSFNDDGESRVFMSF